MLKTLALKELRETIGMAAVALVLFAACVADGMGIHVVPWATGRGATVPFVNDPSLTLLAGIAVLLAVALGFRQSAWESAFGTDQFLLHRPLGRRQLIGVKLLVGAGLVVLCSTLPILAYAWWAATPGTHASPFEWSMTEPFWRIPVATTIVYLGSFLSGIRPARWVGTRLVPLVGAASLGAFLAGIAPLFMGLPVWWIWWAGLVVVVDALLVVSILFVFQTRDF